MAEITAAMVKELREQTGTTKLVNIKNQDMVTKVIDMIPDIVDKFTAPKEEMMEDDAAVDIAFPEENK